MNSVLDDAALPAPGCPIRTSSDQSLLSGSPKLIAASHALLRLLAPRHPPYALSSLTFRFLPTTTAPSSQIRITRMQLSKTGNDRISTARSFGRERDSVVLKNHSHNEKWS
jgi:hypothetical protein